jgi:transcriptional regulator with XRE-family HTH domain
VTPAEYIGGRIGFLREQRGMRRGQFAKKAGVSLATLGEAERGIRGAPRLDTLVRYARALEVTVATHDELGEEAMTAASMLATAVTPADIAHALQCGKTHAYELVAKIDAWARDRGLPGRIAAGRIVRLHRAAWDAWLAAGGEDTWSRSGSAGRSTKHAGGSRSSGRMARSAASGTRSAPDSATELWLRRLDADSSASR